MRLVGYLKQKYITMHGNMNVKWSSRFVRYGSDQLQDRTASRLLLQQYSGHEGGPFSKITLKAGRFERDHVVYTCIGFTKKGLKDVLHFTFFAGTMTL